MPNNYPYDTVTLEHNDLDMGYLRKRDGVAVGFYPRQPLKDDPDRSVYDDVPPMPDIRPWYVQQGDGV